MTDTLQKPPEECCDDCRRKFPTDAKRITTICHATICEECADDSYVIAYNGDYIHHEYAVYAHDTCEYYHIDSGETFYCEDCDNTYTHDTECHSVDHGGRLVCDRCLHYGDYRWCIDIEGYVYVENTHYCEADDNFYYDPDEMPETIGQLHCYSTNVFNVLGRKAFVQGKETHHFGQSVVMGVELETDTRHITDIPAELYEHTDLMDYAICKADATCSGPEIVTLPADLESHKSVYSWSSWFEILRPIAKGYYGGDNGIHIHINRECMTPTQLGKALVFMNSIDNRAFVEVVAQRPVNNWCEGNSQKYSSVAKACIEPANGKYSIVNVTRETAEFRIFNSTLIPERMLKNLEFCDALVHWCRFSSSNHKDDYMRPARFIDYVHSMSGVYPHLSEFLNNRWS